MMSYSDHVILRVRTDTVLGLDEILSGVNDVNRKRSVLMALVT